MSKVGVYLFFALLLAGYLNDWTMRLMGGKVYLSTVTVVLVPVVWLASGQALKGLRDKIGIWWIGFLLLMLMGLPFSYWKSGSLALISAYSFRSFALYFYIVTFMSTVARCRSLMILNVVCSVIVLLTCAAFGSSGGGGERFQIADSIFFANSNELGLQLLLGMTFFLFLFYLGGARRIILGLAGLLLSFSYMIKTGSRGCLLSAILLFVAVFVLSKKKGQITLVIVPLMIIGLVLSPAASLRRLSLIFQSNPQGALSESDLSTLESSRERQELLRKGLVYTFTHPIFGVGAGQFAVAVAGDAAKTGQHEAWLGTHNSYVQVSAECGIPAFICYISVILAGLNRIYRVFRFSQGKPEFRDIEGLAFSLLCGLVVYAFATFFFHMAYTGLLPLLSGQIVALSNAAEPLFKARMVKVNASPAPGIRPNIWMPPALSPAR